jgi:hypothetical protein
LSSPIGAIVLAAVGLAALVAKVARAGLDLGALDLFVPAAAVSSAWWIWRRRDGSRAFWSALAAAILGLAALVGSAEVRAVVVLGVILGVAFRDPRPGGLPLRILSAVGALFLALVGGLSLNSVLIEASALTGAIGVALVLASGVVLTLPMGVAFVSRHGLTNLVVMAFVGSIAMIGAPFTYGSLDAEAQRALAGISAALGVKNAVAGVLFAALPMLVAAEELRA